MTGRSAQTNPVRLSLQRGREIAIMAQLLDRSSTAGLPAVVSHLGFVQMDPTAPVARTEHLLLRSRLGNEYRPGMLTQAVHRDRELFQFRAHIYPAEDFPLYRPVMKAWPRGNTSWPVRARAWLEANRGFQTYILDKLKAEGELTSSRFEDRAITDWPSGGWTNGRNVGQMLEFMAARGQVAVSGYQGNQRVWDLSERVFPVSLPEIEPDEAKRILAERRLRAAGIVAAPKTEGPGTLAEIEGLAGRWLVHSEYLDRPFTGRAALLSPFDRLVYDRARLQALFGFEYRLEIYVPMAKRRWGYYVLPVLSGSRLIGRVDLRYEKREREMKTIAIHMEAGTGAAEEETVREQIEQVATWCRLCSDDAGR